MEVSGCSFQKVTAPSSTAAAESGERQGGIQGHKDTGLNRDVPVFLEWLNTEMMTKGWLGAEADGKERNMSLCTHNNQLCVSSNHKQVFKEERILFPGLLWWSGIHSRNYFQYVVCFYTQLTE